jgi:hypothetical protein
MLPNPYVLLAILVTWLASASGVGWWAYHQGENAVKAADAQVLAASAARIKAMEEAARKAEADHAAAIAAVSDGYNKEIQSVQANNQRVVAGLNAGLVRLRDRWAVPGRDCPAPGAAAGSGRDNAAASGRDLSATASGFLLRLTARADYLAAQLRACQALVREDRKTAQY